jgi:hypothetical protein
MAVQSRTPRACPLLWSLSGDKRTLNDHRKLVADDPSRHFTTINSRSAKSSFTLMGIPGQP